MLVIIRGATALSYAIAPLSCSRDFPAHNIFLARK
jgi:hypothetical protein